MNVFERWWHEKDQYLTDLTEKEIARAAWAAAIDWWSEQLNTVVKIPPKEKTTEEQTNEKT